MNLCHAAALALVGWYLMAPPSVLTTDDRGKSIPFADQSAPLSHWRIVQSFDSAARCQKAAAELLDASLSVKPKRPETRSEVGARLGWAMAYKCVATDDPRLAK